MINLVNIGNLASCLFYCVFLLNIMQIGRGFEGVLKVALALEFWSNRVHITSSGL